MHNFSLLHDDVMDRDPIRRHRPTAWNVFGAEQAILAGNAVLAMAYRATAKCDAPLAGTATQWLSELVVELCEGQSADLAFERRDDVDLTQCLAMVERKTASLLGGSCALGALFAGADSGRVKALRQFGRHPGIAFQLVDDLLGIWGDPAVTGKPAGADLMARKKSVPVTIALNSGTDAGAALGELYRRAAPLSPAQVATAARLVEAAGGREWARQRAGAEIAAATNALRSTSMAGPAVTDLLEFAALTLDRDR